jgi:hypothetical protein
MGANKIYCAHRDILCVHNELYENPTIFYLFKKYLEQSLF